MTAFLSSEYLSKNASSIFFYAVHSIKLTVQRISEKRQALHTVRRTMIGVQFKRESGSLFSEILTEFVLRMTFQKSYRLTLLCFLSR